jgi:alkaline phosphatase D
MSNVAAEEDQASLHYRLFIDGQERWNITVKTPPTPRNNEKNAGSFWDFLKGYGA